MINYTALPPPPPVAFAPTWHSQSIEDLDRAEAYLASGLIAEAEELFAAQLTSAVGPRAQMGLVQCAYHRRNMHEALSHLQSLARIDPNYPDLENNLGVVLYELGMLAEAKQQFKEAAAKAPPNPQPWRNLMDIAAKENDLETCLECCQQILKLNPEDKEAQALLDSAQEQIKTKEKATPSSSHLGQLPQAPVENHRTPMSAPGIAPAEIQGVRIVPLVARVDDRGYLIEILRAPDDHFTQFGQVDLVGDLKAGTIRAFHKHEKLWHWFFISHGSAKFVLRDDRTDSPTYGRMTNIVTGERNPALVVVPPGVYHGWMALSDDTQLISTASDVYNRDKPDDVRIPPDSFGDVWSVQGR